MARLVKSKEPCEEIIEKPDARGFSTDYYFYPRFGVDPVVEVRVHRNRSGKFGWKVFRQFFVRWGLKWGNEVDTAEDLQDAFRIRDAGKPVNLRPRRKS